MRYFLFLILTFFSISAFSQNLGSIQIGGNTTTGTIQSYAFTSSLDFSKKLKNLMIGSNSTYRWSEKSVSGSNQLALFENEFYTMDYISLELKKQFKVLAFTEDQSSYTRKVKFLSSVGIGAGLSILTKGRFKLSFSEALMPEKYESELKSSYDNESIRSSSRLKIEYKLKKVDISSINLYQPSIYSEKNLKYSQNLNFRSTNSITMPLTKTYSIGFTYTDSYIGYSHYLNPKIKAEDKSTSLVLKVCF